jgi:hydrogenase/urease accessory protein HupE
MNKPCASLLVAVLLLLWPTLGHAHDQSRAFAALTARPDGAFAVRLEMSEADLLQILTELPAQGALPPTEITDAAAQARLKDAFPTWFTLAGDGEPCPLRFDEAELAGVQGVLLHGTAQCPDAPARLDARWNLPDQIKFDLALITNVHSVEGVAHPGVLARATPALSLVLREPSRAETFGQFFKLGVEHILLGWDHLAFLLALLLACNTWRRLLTIVSGFTLAHSATMALGALGLVPFSPAVVEPIIAASIALTAVLGLVRLRRGTLRHPGHASPPTSPWVELAVCLGFGLVHGLGFASMLQDALGDDTSDLLLPLLSFNAGVEVGQLMCVAFAFPLLTLAGRRSFGPRAFAVVLLGLTALGLVVTLARVFG